MAIFKTLFKKKAPPPPRLYNGMPATVLNEEGARIFSGRLRIMDDDVLEVRAAENAPPVPPPVYRQRVKVRLSPGGGEAVTLNGVILGSGLRVWRIERQRRAAARSSTLYVPNNRDAFRQNTGIEGQILTPLGQVLPCEVRDISAAGAQVATSRLFQLNTRFRLEVTLLPDEAPFYLDCQIRRTQVKPGSASFSKKYRYGCQFLDVPTREQERLLRILFILERNSARGWEDSL